MTTKQINTQLITFLLIFVASNFSFDVKAQVDRSLNSASEKAEFFSKANQGVVGASISEYIDSAHKASAERHFLLGVELLSVANTEQQFSLARDQFEKGASLVNNSN